MNKKYILIFLAIIVAIGAALFFRGTKPNEDIPGGNIGSSVVKGGWIEVLAGEALLVENKSGIVAKKKLSTGDSVAEGDVLEVSSTGKANIHFFDGSVLRASQGTRFTISMAEFNKDSGTLRVKASLATGKIWSKIVELATPEALWQVETSNTVATVRGSAFGVSFDGKNSEIVGSQHKVTVEVRDSKTKEKLEISALAVSEGVYLRITDSDVQKIKALEERARVATPAEKAAILKSAEAVLAVAPIDDKLRAQEWFKENEEEDKKTESDIQKVKDEVGNNKAEFRSAINKHAEERFQEVKNKEEETLKDKPVEVQETEVKKQEVEVSKQSGAGTPASWVSLAVEPTRGLDDLTEQDTVSFKAILHADNGATRDVTSDATWSVSGQMGSINSKGVFTAQLDPLISEMGEGGGSVVATWKGSDGAVMRAESKQIHVVQKIEGTVENG